jgi:hypothetical protein
MASQIPAQPRSNKTVATLAVVMMALGLAARAMAQSGPQEPADLVVSDARANGEFSVLAAVDGNTALVGAHDDEQAAITDADPPQLSDPNDLGACCFDYWTCHVMIEDDCYGYGGMMWLAGQTCEPDPCPFYKGDMNCDHYLNMDDVPYFVAALIGGYTGCDISLADMDYSGSADGEDIWLFVFFLQWTPP